jgi:DNA anti-recombination protein RmuC
MRLSEFGLLFLGVQPARSVVAFEAMRFPMLARLPLVAVLLLACSHAEEEKAKLAELQKKADERVAQAESQAKMKLADLQKELDDVKLELTKAKTATADALTKAQTSAEEQAKAAEAALTKARQAYKEKARLELSDANKELAEVQGKVGKVAAKSKAAVTTLMQDISKQQKALAKDIAAFDAATLDTFKATSAQFQKDLAILKAKIRAVKAKVP